MLAKRLHQRYLSLPYSIFGIILAVIFGAIAVISWRNPEESPSVRMVIPIYLFSVYWVLVALCNIRTAVIATHEVRDIVWPFPVHIPRRTKRSAIRHCFVRGVTIMDEGTVLEDYNMVGVETLAGLQIDLSGPHNSIEEATQAAAEIAGILNIEIRDVSQTPTRREIFSRLLRLAFWAVIGFSTLFLGFEWEEVHHRTRHTATGVGLVSVRVQATNSGSR